MALIAGTKDNYTHVEFKDRRGGTHTMNKKFFQAWANDVIDLKYFIVNND